MSILRLVGKGDREAKANRIITGNAQQKRVAQPKTRVSACAGGPEGEVFEFDFDPYDPDFKPWEPEGPASLTSDTCLPFVNE